MLMRIKIQQLYSNFVQESLKAESSYQFSTQTLITLQTLYLMMPLSNSIIPLKTQSLHSNYFQSLGFFIRPYSLLEEYKLIIQIIMLAYTFSLIMLSISLVLLIKKQISPYLKKAVCIHWILLDTYLIYLSLYFYDYGVLSTIVNILLIIFIIFRILVLKHAVILKNLNLTKLTMWTISCYFLNLVQAIIQQINDFQTLVVIQQILSILISTFQLVDIVQSGVYYHQRMVKNGIFICISTFTFNILMLIHQTNNFDIINVQLIFIIIVPLFYRVTNQYFFYMMIQAFHNSQDVNTPLLITYLSKDFDYQNQRLLFENLAVKSQSLYQIPYRKFETDMDQMKFYIERRINSIEDLDLKFCLLCTYEYTYEVFKIFTQKNLEEQVDSNRLAVYYDLNKQNFYSLQNKSDQKQNSQIAMLTNHFIKSENSSKGFVQRLIQVFQYKIEFYQLLEMKKLSVQQIYNKAFILTQQLDEFIKDLQYSQSQYPNSKLQKIITIVYSEVLNDLLSARRIFQQINLKDFKEQQYDLFYKQVTYMNIDIQSKLIIKCSNKDFFQQHRITFESLIPNCINKTHDKYIDEFLRTGQSKFFKTMGESFFITDNSLLVSTKFFFDLDMTSGIHATCFITKALDACPLILVDNQWNIQGMNQEFFKAIQIQLDDLQFLLNLQLDLLFPDYLQSVEDQELTLQFLQEPRLREFIFFRKSKENQDVLTLESFWQGELEYYNCSCQFFFKENYTIIKINYIRRVNKGFSDSNSFRSSRKYENSEYEEDVVLQSPYSEILIDFPLLSKEESMLHMEKLLQTDEKNYELTRRNKTIIQQRKQHKYFTKKIEPELSLSKHLSLNIDQNEKRSVNSISSVMNDTLLFSSKYNYIDKILHSKNQNQNHKIISLLLLTFFILTTISSILSYQYSDQSFNAYLTDIQLLQVKNYLFQPIEAFIVTRLTIINYNTQFSDKVITSSQLSYYLTFPNSNLELGFDDINYKMDYIKNTLKLQDFLNQEHDVNMYKSTNTGEIYIFNMRQMLQILINYQYQFKAAYIYDGRTNTDSPYIYYSYRNLLKLYNPFDDLNQQLYAQSIDKNTEELEISLSLFLPFILLALILMILIHVFYRKINTICELLFGQVYYSDVKIISLDIQRYKFYISQLADQNFLFNYTYNIEKKEEALNAQKEKYRGMISDKKSYLKRVKLQSYKAILWLSLLFSVFIIFSSVLYYLQYSYFKYYTQTAEFYFLMANLGTNIPTIYAMREVLYFRWRYPYYDNDDFAQLLQQIKVCLNETQFFSSYLTKISENDFLLSPQFMAYIEDIKMNNLCEFQPEELYNKSKGFCNSTLGGSLQDGLQGTLIYIINSVTGEMQINNFLNKTAPTVMELEGAFIVSEIIKELNLLMRLDFTNVTEGNLLNIQILFIIYVLFVLLSLCTIYFYIDPVLQLQYYVVKRFIYLIPQQILFLDEAFERQSGYIFAKMK